MIRHRWGAPYGDDLESLAVETDWLELTYNPSREDLNDYQDTTTRCLGRLTVKPEIVWDKLTLRTVQHIWYDRDVWDDVKRSVEEFPFITCQHAKPAFHPQRENFRGVPYVPQKRPRSTRFRLLRQRRLPTGMEKGQNFDCTKCISKYFFTYWDHGEAGIEIGLYIWTDLGACYFNMTRQWILATDPSARAYQNRWPYYDSKCALRMAFNSYGKIAEADSEIGHRSFEQAKHNLAIRNQRLRALKLRSEPRGQGTVESSPCQDDHSEVSEQNLAKKSRVLRVVDQLLMAVRHPFGRKKL